MQTKRQEVNYISSLLQVELEYIEQIKGRSPDTRHLLK
jgi:hypothetical protein